MRQTWAFGLAIALSSASSIGCGAGAGQGTGPKTPETMPPAGQGKAPVQVDGKTPAGPAAAKGDPWALPEGPRDDAPVAPPLPVYPLEQWKKASAVKGLSAVPKECAAFVSRAAAKNAPADLVSALAESDAAKRDAALVARDAKEAAGLVRALRAELAPVECADGLVDPYLEKANVNAMNAPHSHALVGLSLAAKLARTAHDPPTLPSAATKETIKKFVMGPLKTWVTDQAIAIETLGAGAAALQGYGRGIAAIEAGHAELRLVDQLRSAPTPKEWDAELKAVYEAALDEALEPRKARGRDAVLVGLSDMADAGVVKDARVTRARALLAKLYGGRRIDALDRLVLPEMPKAPAATPLARAAVAVPVFWVDTLGGPFEAVASGEDGAWMTVLARGIPRASRAKMRANLSDVHPATASAYARARLELGRVSFRRIDFVEAAHAAKRAGARDDDKLVLATSLALAAGPNGARAVMTAPPGKMDGWRETPALDALVAERGPTAGAAAFDGAFLRSLAAADNGSKAAWQDVAARFRQAAKLLPASAKDAEACAAEADAAAKVAP